MKAYKNANFKKEKKTATLLGWFNVIVGFVLMLVNWGSKIFMW
ncbi:CLC_0170 family protein [Neobacillus drentensis]